MELNGHLPVWARKRFIGEFLFILVMVVGFRMMSGYPWVIGRTLFFIPFLMSIAHLIMVIRDARREAKERPGRTQPSLLDPEREWKLRA